MIKQFIALGIISAIFLSCGGRIPSPKTASGIIQHHFHKYGKKYKDSIFGYSDVKNVQIDSINEIHKHYVAVMAYINLINGDSVKARVTLQKKTFGWQYVSWENMMNDLDLGLTVR